MLTKQLNNGHHIPMLGFGTWQLEGDECTDAVRCALDVGYTHIDTAEAYDNEEAIGRAIEGVDRVGLFLTSKAWHEHLAPKALKAACYSSLGRLGTDYLDLYLIHWPRQGTDYLAAFAALQELCEEGKIRAAGVSNFTTAHLHEFLPAAHKAGLTLEMNQVEYHPGLDQIDLLEYCREQQILLTAYSPLARGQAPEDELLQKIGESHDKSAAQVALRWLLQRGVVAIPKSSSPERIKENFALFDFSLSKAEMADIAQLGQDQRLIHPDFAEFDWKPGKDES